MTDAKKDVKEGAGQRPNFKPETKVLTEAERIQAEKVVEGFEAICRSQPNDYDSLQILLEIHYKLGNHDDVLLVRKKLVRAYIEDAQFSSAIMECEVILEHNPDDADAKRLMAEIRQRCDPEPE